MGSSLSNPELREGVEQVRRLSKNDVGKCLIAYVKSVGINTHRLSRDQCLKIFSCIEAHKILPHDLNEIPALQLLATLYFMSAPSITAPDENFDAVMSLCQFKPIDANSSRHNFHHVKPNSTCTPAEVHVAIEVTALGLMRLCSKTNEVADFMGRILTIVDETIGAVVRTDPSIIPADTPLRWLEIKHMLMENKHVSAFLSSFGVDMISIKTLQQRVLLNVRKIDELLQANKAPPAGTSTTSGKGNWNLLRTSTISKSKNPFETAAAKLGSPKSRALAAVAPALVCTPRECLQLINKSSNASDPSSNFEFSSEEIDELVGLLELCAGSTVDQSFVKLLSVAVCAFHLVRQSSRFSYDRIGISENCLNYLHRLFNLCAAEIGFKDIADFAVPSDMKGGPVPSIAGRATGGVVSGTILSGGSNGDLYDLLQPDASVIQQSNAALQLPFPGMRFLARVDWLKFLIKYRYRRQHQTCQQDEGVIAFFQSRSQEGYVSLNNSEVLYEFVKWALCAVSRTAFQQINVAQLAAADEVPDNERAVDTILRQHLHYMVHKIKQTCMCDDRSSKLSLKLIRDQSAAIREDINAFANYFLKLHSS